MEPRAMLAQGGTSSPNQGFEHSFDDTSVINLPTSSAWYSQEVFLNVFILASVS